MNESSSGRPVAPSTYFPVTEEDHWKILKQCKTMIINIFNNTQYRNQTNMTKEEEEFLARHDTALKGPPTEVIVYTNNESKEDTVVLNWSDIINPEFITTILSGIISFIALMVSDTKDKFIGVLLGTLLLYFNNFEPSSMVLASAGGMLFSNFAREFYNKSNTNKDKPYYEVAVDTLKDMRKNGIVRTIITYETLRKTIRGEKSLKMLLPKILRADSNPYLKLYVPAA